MSADGKSVAVRVAVVLIIGILIAGVGSYVYDRQGGHRGEALSDALRTLEHGPNRDQAVVAAAIWESYLGARTNASRWSGVYWGSTFLAAALSALAGLILKFESVVKNESMKKDVAACLSVSAALLITISTSGDFQRKWQANRIAAADFEKIGYDLLARPDADPRVYFAAIGSISHQRHAAIVGSMQPATSKQGPADTSSAGPSK